MAQRTEQQTAVEWLIKEIQNRQNGIVDSLPVLSTDELYVKAKQMHKQQIMHAYVEASPKLEDITIESAEQYYNDTYKK